MTRTPQISIGMPVHNGERWVSRSIESILNQSFADFELIISDNDSTDGTQAICRRFAEADSRINYIHQPKNVGASANFSFVFRAARAPYFKWTSSNDLCAETFLEKCLSALLSRPELALCFPRTRLFHDDPDDGEEYFDDLNLLDDRPCRRFEKLLRELRLNNIFNGLIRSEILGRTPLVKPYHSSDMVLMAEISLYGKFLEIPEYLYFRRMDRETSTSLMSEEKVREHYDPQRKSMMLFQNWRMHMGYLGAAFRAPLTLSERACVLAQVFRHINWNRMRLAGDVREAFHKNWARGSSAMHSDGR